jgi:predicted ATPase
MIYVAPKSLVARAIRRLRGRQIHPLFAGYLHLQERAAHLGRPEDLQPDFSGFYKRYFYVPDHPIGTPYIKPFTDKPANVRNLWLNKNVAGSYAPSSLREDQPFRRVVQIDADGRYSLRPNHARLARKHLLYDQAVSAVDLAIFLYRDYGLTGTEIVAASFVDVFVERFGYADKLKDRPPNEFDALYEAEDEELSRPLEVASDFDVLRVDGPGLPRMTVEPVRLLKAADLLAEPRVEGTGDPALRAMRVRGLLSFGERADFEFGRLNLLVGPNGSGKSNVIDCIRLLSAAPRDIQLPFANGGFETWLHNGLDRTNAFAEIHVEASVAGLAEVVSHELRLGPPLRSRAQLEERVAGGPNGDEGGTDFFVGGYRSGGTIFPAGAGRRRREHQLGPEYDPQRSILSQIRDVGQYPEITRLAILYSNIRIYSEWTFGRNSKLREAAPTGRSDSRLSESMDDLPVALNALERTPSHQRIIELLPELKETYRDYVTRLLFGRIGLELIEAPYEVTVPATRLSDGTLRFLALAAILLQPDPPPIVCIEEPELGLHPDMIRMVARMMAEASPKTQLIVTTHSEHLLAALQDDFDVVFAFGAGVTGSTVRRFDRKHFEKWRQDHSLGELWTSGEIGGNRW